MSYNFVTDRIEIRSSLDKKKPRYTVKGYALVPNKFDSYGYEKDKEGNVTKVFKSMFTPHCIESIKNQAKHKRLFVDGMHELALNTNIKSLVKDKLTPEEMSKFDSMLDAKRLPLAKLNEIDIDDKGLLIDTELNPMFRELDEKHQKYFDAVWYSLENKYLNGISINFYPTDVITDDNGKEVINDVDIAGFSYVDRTSLPDHNIVEVAIRSAQDFIKSEGDKKMEEQEKAKLAEEKSKLEEERKKLEEEKAQLRKEKEAKEEEAKKEELKKQEEEQKKVKEELEAKQEALKKAEEEKKKLEEQLNSVKGQVKSTSPPSQGTKKEGEKGTEFYKENLKKITEEHDQTMELYKDGKEPLIDGRMKGFGQLVNLGAQANNPTADLDPKDAEFIREHRLLEKAGGDVIAPSIKKI